MVLPTWVVCVASVVCSVSRREYALVRCGAVDAGATALACRGVGQRIRRRPKRNRPITNGAWGLLLVQAVAGVVQVFLWNRGVAGGATMADFQLYKLAAPLWSAVVQAALLDAGALTVTGWWSCAVSAPAKYRNGRGDAANPALRTVRGYGVLPTYVPNVITRSGITGSVRTPARGWARASGLSRRVASPGPRAPAAVPTRSSR